jgi:GNAT superfamily N-acetyltransferase
LGISGIGAPRNRGAPEAIAIPKERCISKLVEANMDKPKIRFLTSQDVVAYRELRLQALRESPTAFASSFEQEACLNVTDFAKRLSTHDNLNSGIFGAFDESDRLIGMLGFSRENRPKRAHIGNLWSMYVLPQFRRRGVGAALLDSALSHARKLGGLRQVILAVTARITCRILTLQVKGFRGFWARA